MQQSPTQELVEWLRWNSEEGGLFNRWTAQEKGKEFGLKSVNASLYGGRKPKAKRVPGTPYGRLI